jgi:hypothetical protein
MKCNLFVGTVVVTVSAFIVSVHGDKERAVNSV